MFTGIIGELGLVKGYKYGNKSGSLKVSAAEVLQGLDLGDSIAVNGVCLTVNKLGHDSFTADVMAETLNRTNLGTLKAGKRVNLERAMVLGSRIDGHLVSGHIDGLGEILAVRPDGNAKVIQVQTAPSITHYLVEKGSVAVDGISLTVVHVDQHSFSISIIPYTAIHTTLNYIQPGDPVNIEVDLLAKYVEKMLGNHKKEDGVNLEFLGRHGFS